MGTKGVTQRPDTRRENKRKWVSYLGPHNLSSGRLRSSNQPVTIPILGPEGGILTVEQKMLNGTSGEGRFNGILGVGGHSQLGYDSLRLFIDRELGTCLANRYINHTCLGPWRCQHRFGASF